MWLFELSIYAYQTPKHFTMEEMTELESYHNNYKIIFILAKIACVAGKCYVASLFIQMF